MRISVIITAYNNEETIEECLGSFINQTLNRKRYEIVVVNDGSEDRTESRIKNQESRDPDIKLKLVNQENQGVAAARNRGAEKAEGEIILFTQADIMAADENLLKHHLDFHTNQPQTTRSLVGRTTWHPDLRITPFMEWLETGGPQFDFRRAFAANSSTSDVKPKTSDVSFGGGSPLFTTDFLNFYTTNVSLKKEFFWNAGGFDEDFRLQAGMTAYEDTELGYRLEKAGMELYYNPQALVYHHHHKNLNDVLRRRYYEGIMSHKLTRKHPDLKWDRPTSDLQVFLLSIWLLNPIIMYLPKLIADYLQDKTFIPKLYKLITRAWYNWGYLIGMVK